MSIFMKILKVNKNTAIYGAATIFGSFLFGNILLIIISLIEKGEEMVTLGAIFTFLASLFYIFIISMISFLNEFNHHLSMCITRKNYLYSTMSMHVLYSAVLSVVVWVLGFLDKIMWSGHPMEDVQMIDILGIPQIFLIMLVASSVGCLMDAMVMKFGKIAIIILWCIYFILVFGPSLIAPSYFKGMDLHAVTSFIEQNIYVFAIALIIICTIINLIMMRKQEVKQ